MNCVGEMSWACRAARGPGIFREGCGGEGWYIQKTALEQGGKVAW